MSGFLRASIALAALVAVIPMAEAQQSRRPDVRRMSCEQAKELVERTGGIVLTTGQHTYDRYVSDRRFCPSGLDIKDAWVNTGDGKSCRIGYTCVNEPRFPRFNRWD